MARGKLLTVVALLAALAMVTPAVAADRDFNKIETIKIGVMAPVNLVPGIGIVNAAQMAAEKINAKGGVQGKKIQLVIADTEANPEKGITALKKLVLDDNVDVLVGTFSSGVALAQQPFASNYKTVFITTGAASVDITDRVAKDYNRYKYSFRFMINSHRQGAAIGDFITKFVGPKYGVKKVAVVAENAKWAQDEAPMVRKKLEEAGFEVPFYEFFDVDIKDFSPLFAKIQRSGAQFMVQLVSHSSSVPFVKGWADAKGLPMGGCDVQGMDGTFWDRTEGKALGVTTFNFMSRSAFTPSTIPFWDEYVERYKAKGYTPVYTSGFTYDIISMLAQVIGEKKSVKSQDLIDGLENITYNGVTSTNAGFQKNDHDIREGAYHLPFIQWQAGGKQTVLYPTTMKTGDMILPAWKR
jgi:branched-chain amino acid transport system substrate-binding protein